MDAPADSTPETQGQETSISPALQPTQIVSESEGDVPRVPSAEGLGLTAPAENRKLVKKTFAKIRYQYELNIDPPEQDATVQRDIMRYIGDNLKMEYKFNDTSFFAFSPMIVTSEENDGNSPLEENRSPFSFSVEGIQTSENWDSGKYETNMTIHLKKRCRPLEDVQAEEAQPNHDKVLETDLARGPYNFIEFIKENKFLLFAIGMVLALFVGSWIGLV